MPEVCPCWPWQQVSPNGYPILCCPEVREMPYLTHNLHETSQMVDNVSQSMSVTTNVACIISMTLMHDTMP